MRYMIGFRSGYGDCLYLADPDYEFHLGERFTTNIRGSLLFQASQAWAVVEELALEFDVVIVERVCD